MMSVENLESDRAVFQGTTSHQLMLAFNHFPANITVPQ